MNTSSMHNSASSLPLVTDNAQLAPTARIWGTGGWVPPEEREALAWLTLAKLSGWSCNLYRAEVDSFQHAFFHNLRWVVFACDPQKIDVALVREIESILQSTPLVLIVRNGNGDLPISRFAGANSTKDVIKDTHIRWATQSYTHYECRKPFVATRLQLMPYFQPLMFADNVPVAAARRIGRGCVVSLGFHPSVARDDNGLVTRLLRKMLVECLELPVAWLDFARIMILRMDDPGTAQNVYKSPWSYPEFNYVKWHEIGRILSEYHASLSVGYCSGWVDDGDSARGTLTVRNKFVARVPGRVYASPEVVYKDENGVRPRTCHDYAGECRALSELCSSGVIDMELHGYTHIHPDYFEWAKSEDRYDAVHWYRELGSRAMPVLALLQKHEHPLSLGMTIQRYFSAWPTTLICPGYEWTNEVLEHALNLGISFVSSYYFALRYKDTLCWTTHVCAPYIDEPDNAWFDSELPVMCYFHDREPSVYGPRWIDDCLENWITAGATRFLTFHDLAFLLDLELNIRWTKEGLLISLKGNTVLPTAMPIILRIQLPEVVNNCQIEAEYKGFFCPVSIQWIDVTTVRVEVKLQGVPLPMDNAP